ncbi:hypothetical protein OHB14_30190 [Streptomyces sp. NBC_01613]|uniref:hypothetical protein n=1 Tax=Streptomyces sp. NBC_01613 TaxID=2975896 RepID=UPI003865D447
MDIVRHARVYGRDGELVVRNRHLRERVHLLGDGGIVRAVFAPPAGTDANTRGASADRWGVVDFQGTDGKVILRIPLAEWLPEAGLVGLISLSPKECLERTGLPSLVAGLGIPLDESVPSPESPSGDENSGTRPDRLVHRDLPAWHSWIRGIGILVWFAFLLIIPMTGNGNRWTVFTASVGLLLVPGADLALRVLVWSRSRRDRILAGAEVVVPSPGSGAAATRRFCGTAAVQVLAGDVVLTDTLAEERWLPRGGARGVTRLVRLLDPWSGAVLGVEFRDRRNAVRALLPWQPWFAGPGGSEAWSRLVAALGVPVSDEKTKRGRGTEPWWTDHTMAADARKMSPLPAKEARRGTSWRSSVIGGGEPIVVPILSLLPLIGLASTRGIAQVTGALAAMTIVAELVPVISHHLISRFKLDRPVEPELP